MLPVSDSINVNISYNVLLLEANMKINLHNDTWKFETRYKRCNYHYQVLPPAGNHRPSSPQGEFLQPRGRFCLKVDLLLKLY